MLRLIFLVICFWSSLLSAGWRWWNLHLDGERSAAFHAFVEAICAIDAHISVAAGEDDGVVVFRVELFEAYHAMKRERRGRHGWQTVVRKLRRIKLSELCTASR